MLRRIVTVLVLVGSALLMESALPLAPFRAAGPGQAGPPAVRDLQLLTENEGWLLAGRDLYWTHTGGRRWATITPTYAGHWATQAAFFLDTQRGWAVLTEDDGTGQAHYALARTSDTGETWQVTPLTLFTPGDPRANPGAVYLSFIDGEKGWLVVKRATSSNFSTGTLFRTLDGGNTWAELALPIGEPVYFVTAELGWTAGGAAGDELYRTDDGGATWTRSGPGPLTGGSARRQLLRPIFTSDREGTLPVIVTEADETRVELYATGDAGQTWHLSARTSAGRGLGPAPRIPMAVFDEERWLVVSPETGRATRGPRWAPGASAGPSALPQGIVQLSMLNPQVGWARQAAGDCQADAGSPAAVRCSQTQALLRTDDGGQTWQALALPQAAGATSADLLSSSVEAPLPGAEPTAGSAGRTQVFAGQGFDSCTMPSLTQMQTWYASSPYRVWNLYLGGSARANCGTLTASYISQLAQQGWKFIPTWVGPQAACSGFSSLMSSDPTTAYNQGVAEANAAANVAASLGLAAADGSGTIIYYDLEAYNTKDTTCRAAARSFISGWTAQLHARGDKAGVYGATCSSALSDFALIAHVPDAIWAAVWLTPYQYRSDASVWNLVCLDNTLWSNSQRLRQYSGGHDETWGAVTLNIDSDVLQGVVANICPGCDQPPSPPQNLVASDGTYADSVRVTWAAVPGATSYAVYRSTADDSAAATLVGTTTTTSYSDATALRATVYWYWVKAQNAAGTSELSSGDSGYRQQAMPTSVNASDNTFTDQVRITWTAAVSATTYTVYRNTANNHTSETVLATVPASPYEDKSAMPSVTYYYWVVANNDAGYSSAYSASNSGVRKQPPPTEVSASDNASPNWVQVTWSPAYGATGYDVYRYTLNASGSASKIGTVEASPYNDVTATPDKTYWYWVKARNSIGTSGFSNGDSGMRQLVVPSGAENVVASDGTFADRVRVTWSADVMAASYEVLRAAMGDGDAVLIGTTTGTSFDDLKALRATKYDYYVRGKNRLGSGPSGGDTGYRMQAAPGSVSASDGTYSEKVRITWTAAVSATTYTVYRNTANNHTGETVFDPVPASPYEDTSAVPGITYYYWVRANNGAYSSAYSAVNSGWRKLLPPANVAASDNAYSDRVQVTWAAAEGADSYDVYRYTSNSSGSATKIGTAEGTSYDDTTAYPGKTYWYWVKAKNVARTSAFSTGDSGMRLLLPPAAPGDVAASDGTYGDRIRVTWVATWTATSYDVYRDTDGDSAGATLVRTTTGTSYDDTAAAKGTIYWYWVIAKNAAGVSGLSAGDSGYKQQAVPTGVSASDGAYADKVRVTWVAASGATSYTVYRTPANNHTDEVELASVTAPPYDDTSTVPGTTYYYWVKANNAAYSSAYSASNSGYRGQPAPTGVSATDNLTDKITITWDAAVGATSYEVYRYTSNSSGSASKIGTVTGTSYDDVTAVPGKTYWYWIKARNSKGSSPFSQGDSGYRSP